MPIELQMAIQKIQEGSLDHVFNAPLSSNPICGSPCFGRTLRIFWLSVLIGTSVFLAVPANVMYDTLGNEGADQIPFTPTAWNEFLAGPSSETVNLFLSLYLTVKGGLALEKYARAWWLSKKYLNAPYSCSKVVKDGASTLGSMGLAAVAAYILYGLSKVEGSSFISGITLVDNIIQYYFGAKTVISWFVGSLASCCKKPDTSNVLTLKKALPKLKKLKEELEENGNEINSLSGRPDAEELSQYIGERISNYPSEPENGLWQRFKKSSCPVRTVHALLQIIQITSNIGYWYSAVEQVDNPNEKLQYALGSFGFIPFALLSAMFTFDTTNFLINFAADISKSCKRKSEQEQKLLSTESPMTPITANGVNTHADENSIEFSYSKGHKTLMVSLDILKFIGYVLSYYSSATSLKLNLDTNWPWVRTLWIILPTVIGVSVFNGYAIKDSVDELKNYRKIKQFAQNRQHAIYTVEKLICLAEFNGEQELVLPLAAPAG